MPIERAVSGEVTAVYEVVGSIARKDTITFAIQAYGHLVPRGRSISMLDFADLIAQHYDTMNPHNAAVVNALRCCTEPVAA